MMVRVCASPSPSSSPIKGEEISGASRRGMMNHALGLDSPFRGNAMTVQRDAAGSLRVSLNPPSFSIPQEWGIQGVEKASRSAVVLFDITRMPECERM
jgi:hypothetical protein